MEEIFLSGYKAEKQGKKILSLGTWGSYGEEQLKISHDNTWENMEIFAVFVLPNKKKARVPVPGNGIIDVPPEAISIFLPLNKPGKLVFEGYGKNIKRLSTEVIYVCLDHAPTNGEDIKPTSPGEIEEYLKRIQNMIDLVVPPKGEINQVLTKTENGNEWKDINGFLDTIEIISGGKVPINKEI